MLRSSPETPLEDNDDQDIFAAIEALMTPEEKAMLESASNPKKRKNPEPLLVSNSIFSGALWPPVEAGITDPSPIHYSVLNKLIRSYKCVNFNTVEKRWVAGKEVEYKGIKYFITPSEILSIFHRMVESVNVTLADEVFQHELVLDYLPYVPHAKLYPLFLSMFLTTNHYSCKSDIWERCPGFVEWFQTSHGRMLEVLLLACQHFSPPVILKTIWDNHASIRRACKYEQDPKITNIILNNLMKLPDHVAKDVIKPKTEVHNAIQNLKEEEIVTLATEYFAMKCMTKEKLQAFINLIENKDALGKIFVKAKKISPQYCRIVVIQRINEIEHSRAHAPIMRR